ncbi:MAG: anthranilate synthase component I family protein, partial [Methylophagaceae bacterium]
MPPLCTELPYHTDSEIYFEAIRTKQWPIFLDSSNKQHVDARFDIQTADPFITLMTLGNNTLITYDSGETQLSSNDPFHLLHDILQQYQPVPKSGLPFCGGALGYFAYDLGRRLETVPELAQDAEHIPSMSVGIYDWAIVSDHKLKKCWLVSYGLNPNTLSIWDNLVAKLQQAALPKVTAKFQVTSPLRHNFDRQHYQQAFDKIQHYIHEGDCYQVNLAKRFEVDAEGDPWYAYQLLRKQNAAPFSAYFSTPHVTVLSSSPERLLKVDDTHVETKPIKGTRPRDLDDPERDKALADELQSSLKDRAENLMIVDLLRNDLGKVCEPGSITVPKPFEL